MLPTGFPRWAVWALNVAVLAGVWLAAYVFKLAGWQVALGFALGALYLFFLFRWHYGWYPDFNMDGEDEKNADLPRIDPNRTNWR